MLLRSIFGKSSRGLLLGGAVLVILVLAFSFVFHFSIGWQKNQSVVGFAVESFMCYQILQRVVYVKKV